MLIVPSADLSLRSPSHETAFKPPILQLNKSSPHQALIFFAFFFFLSFLSPLTGKE